MKEFIMYVKVMDKHYNILTRTTYIVIALTYRDAKQKARIKAKEEYGPSFPDERLYFRTSIGKYK